MSVLNSNGRMDSTAPVNTNRPRDIRGRVVPPEFLPDVTSDSTVEVEVDGRLWLFVRGC
jgi:hypothetical protein